MEISKIREMAKLFADIPIYDTRVGGVASHPFTNTWITGIYDKDRKLTLVDLREELLVYESLPEEVTVYRGVTSYNRKKEKALSWTLDYEKAVWFANRFSTGTGEVWTMTVPKKRILCYFDGGSEQEAIVDLYRFKGKKEVQKV